MSNTIGLYVHIPFCKSKCGYCDFASYSGLADKEDAYINAVIKEAEKYAEKELTAETVYIGGGTPSVLKEGNLTRLVDGISRYINIEAKEFTIEANPESFSESKAREYKSVGADRVSMGLQATQPELLRAIGRIHSYQDFLNALDNAKKIGFKNISADLMYSLPGQTRGCWLCLGFSIYQHMRSSWSRASRCTAASSRRRMRIGRCSML